MPARSPALNALTAPEKGELLEYSPDFADERAAGLVRQCRALAVDLPVDDLVDALTGWEPLFGHGWSTR